MYSVTNSHVQIPVPLISAFQEQIKLMPIEVALGSGSHIQVLVQLIRKPAVEAVVTAAVRGFCFQKMPVLAKGVSPDTQKEFHFLVGPGPGPSQVSAAAAAVERFIPQFGSPSGRIPPQLACATPPNHHFHFHFHFGGGLLSPGVVVARGVHSLLTVGPACHYQRETGNCLCLLEHSASGEVDWL